MLHDSAPQWTQHSTQDLDDAHAEAQVQVQVQAQADDRVVGSRTGLCGMQFKFTFVPHYDLAEHSFCVAADVFCGRAIGFNPEHFKCLMNPE